MQEDIEQLSPLALQDINSQSSRHKETRNFYCGFTTVL